MIDGLFVPIRPAIRSVMPVLMRLPGLTVGGFAADAADGLSVLIRLPISEVLPELIRPVLVDGSLPAPELAPAGLLLPRELLNDLLVPEAVGGRAVLRRLGVAVRG